MFEQMPYTNFHELNLDWIIQKLKEKYGPDNPPENVVLSVNGQTGDVVLYPDAVVRFPDVEEGTWNIHRLAGGASSGIQFLPNKAQRISGTDRYDIYDSGNPPEYPVSSVNGETGAVVLYRSNVVRLPDTGETVWSFYRLADGTQLGIQFIKDAPAQRISGTGRYDIYDEGNPPPYPVQSVNGQTGVVVIDVPVQSVNGQTGNVVIQIPVQSVNGKTGAVNTPFNNINADVLTLETEASDESWGMERPTPDGSLGFTIGYNNGHTEAFIYYDGPGGTTETLKLLTAADIPASSGVVSINGQTGAVTLTGNDIYTTGSSGQTVTAAIQAEASRANTAEQGLAGDIQAEATRAGAAEGALQTAVQTVSTDLTNKVVTTSINIPIPATADGAVRYDMADITADHIVIDWIFTNSLNNDSPVDITVTTYAGYFTIENTAGTTAESVKLVFAIPASKTTELHT